MARVLVVDDDPDLLTLVEMQLRHHGHTVLTASSGHDALDARRRRTDVPDVAVLDVAMPGMNGLDLLQRAPVPRGLRPICPAIFLSARVGPDDIEAGTVARRDVPDEAVRDERAPEAIDGALHADGVSRQLR